MTTLQTFRLERVRTPLGTALLVTDAEGRVRVLNWDEYEERVRRLLQAGRAEGRPTVVESGGASPPSAARLALEAYFDGDIHAVDALPVETGGTPFQREVWSALRTIPAGGTLSYGALALRIGRPSAVRAVGLANGANPVAIIVPCHRVIGANAALTGYGGGLHRKRWLLEHEGVQLGLPLEASQAAR